METIGRVAIYFKGFYGVPTCVDPSSEVLNDPLPHTAWGSKFFWGLGVAGLRFTGLAFHHGLLLPCALWSYLMP